MAKDALVWDKDGERLYKGGVDRGVLFVMDDAGHYGEGVAWNGLTKISQSPEGAEATEKYADNRVYAVVISPEKFKGTIEAFQSPKEFDVCDGEAEIAPGVAITQQTRRKFALCWRTKIASDVKGYDFGEEIHIAYGCKASPSSADNETLNESPEPTTLSWEFSTEQTNVSGKAPTAHVIIRSSRIEEEKFKKVQEMLYGKAPTSQGGTDGVAPKLPTPDEIKTLVS